MARRASSDSNEFIAPSDPEKLVAWLDAKRESGKSVMPEYQMKMNMSFMLGEQWLVWDKSNRQFRRPRTRNDDPNAPVRITVNKIGSLMERLVAKLIKNLPIPEARPVSDEDNDVAGARVGTRILDHELRRLQWRSKLAEFLFWPGTLGSSYMKIYWDPESGEPLGDFDGIDVSTGDIDMSIVPAFELAVNPGAKAMKGARWAVHSTIMSREDAYEKWGVQLKASGKTRSIISEVMSMNDAEQDQGKNADQWVEVHQLWMLPSRAAPDGMVVTWAGQTIVQKPKRFPYKVKRLPFYEMRWLPPFGSREGRTWVKDAIPLQVDYNDARSREATIRRQLTPKLLAPIGSIDPSRYTSRVEVIPYAPTGNPPSLQIPDSGWMNQWEVGMERAESEMGNRAGVNEATQGQVGASTPAAAILALQEADDTKLALTANMMAEFTVEVGQAILNLVNEFWTEERVVRTYSEDNYVDVYRYRGSDVTGVDVHVSPESALPRSKSARVQLMLELHARGVIRDNVTLIRALDLPGTDSLVRDEDIDSRLQRRELGKLLNGEDQPVYPFHDHLVHLKVINGFRKGGEYPKLPPATQARIDAHAGMHEALVLKALGAPTTANGNPYDPAAGQAAAAVTTSGQTPPPGAGGGSGYLLDPLTGLPPTGLDMASGAVPSPVSDDGIYNQAGIGNAAGQPGRVPGIPADNQAASMGN